MSLKTYAADEVQVIFAGIPLSALGGYGDGTFVKIEQNEDSFTLLVGSNGDSTRSRTNNRSATITVTLQQSSDANDLLSDLHNLDLNSPGGAGIGPLYIRDGSGRALYVAEKAWVKKPPSVEFGREAGPREWTLETHALIRLDAGN